MDILQIIYLAVIIISIIASGFFSMTETAYASMNKYRVQGLSEDGKRSAKAALWLNRRFDSTLIAILIGNNAVNVAVSFLATALFIAWMPESVSVTWSSLIATAVTTILVYIFGETLPKQVGKKMPTRIAMGTSYLLIAIFILLFPLTIIFYGLSRLAQLMFRGKKEPELTEQDFNDILDNNEDAGVLEENETDIIQNTFDFTDTAVKDVFTPRQKMTMINMKGMTNDALVRKLMGINYSRIPVFYDNPDKIVGVLVVKNYLAAYLKDPHVRIADVLVKPYIVSLSITMDEMVEGFRKNHTQIALVYKDNRLLGMVTTEDVLEELVGPIGEKTTKETAQ